MKLKGIYLTGLSLLSIALFLSCASTPVKRFYLINYEPNPIKNRLNPQPYPYVIRIKEFSIEQAYAKPQIVYRSNPYELQYYFFRVWAVKPTRMITDLIYKHINAIGLVQRVVERFDEGTEPPQYELTGSIEAIEEYDSDKIWFAHIALRITLTRLKDNTVVFMKRFDERKTVYQQTPDEVVKALSQITDYIMTQSIDGIDLVLAKESGIVPTPQIKTSEESK